jgi:hypothetical protein
MYIHIPLIQMQSKVIIAPNCALHEPE